MLINYGTSVFGTPDMRRAFVGVMRIVATARETRPFDGPRSELVKMFAGLVGCSGCHGFEKSLDFSQFLGINSPWENELEGLEKIKSWLPRSEDRQEAVHAGLLISMYSPEPDPIATQVARWIAQELGVDDKFAQSIEKVANENAALAKADVFRRMLSDRTGINQEIIANQMAKHALAEISSKEMVEKYHRLLKDAPDESLGAEMRKFYKDANFDWPGMPSVPLPVEFLGAHDVHHVLAGYEANAHGEVYCAVFNAANSSKGIGWLSVVLLQWHQGIKLGVFPPAHAHLNPEIMAKAAKRGSETIVDIYNENWDWLPLLLKPLSEVRNQLGIPSGGTVESGASWCPP